MGDVCIDTITNRPRTPNDQYTFLSDEQIGNIKQNTSTFFDVQKGDPSAGIYTPKEGGRFYRDRYTDITSQHLTKVPNASQAFGWINFQHNRFPPEQYNTCRERASVRWGPNKAGERTRSHYFGEDPERYTTIDMYRRNPTTYAGRVVMDCGRPGDGYYAQKFPDRTTWFGSNVPLNRTNIMESVYQKTMAEYEEIKEAEKTARLARQEQWPEYSEYTDKFLLATKTQQTLSPLEEKKRYSQSAKTTREGTVKKMDDTCTGEKQTAPNSAASHRPLSTEKL